MIVETNKSLITPEVTDRITIELLDLTIRNLPDFHQFGLLDFISNAGGELNINDGLIFKNVKLMLIKLKYVEALRPTSQIFLLTDLGRNVKSIGGHSAYLKTLDESLEIERNHKEVEYLNNKSSAELNTYLYKTRWLPHILALIATIISIIALCYSIEA